jgi:hypothetical protein
MRMVGPIRCTSALRSFTARLHKQRPIEILINEDVQTLNDGGVCGFYYTQWLMWINLTPPEEGAHSPSDQTGLLSLSDVGLWDYSLSSLTRCVHCSL